MSAANDLLLLQLLALIIDLINGDTTIEAARARAKALGEHIDTDDARDLLEALEADPPGEQ